MAILIMENDADLLDILCFALRRQGHDVIAAHDGAAGLHLWQSKAPRLVLTTTDLPRVSGWEVVKRIRSESDTPVIMLTSSQADAEIVRGLELGTDDAVAKPFSPRVLLARMDAVLRRAKESADQPRKGWQVIAAGDLKLDPQWRTVYRGEEPVRLTPIEFNMTRRFRRQPT